MMVMFGGVAIAPAATVVLLRQRHGQLETLLVQRSAALAFGPGHWVFPGGRIDAGDYLRANSTRPAVAARLAAVREAQEEVALQLEPKQLLALSLWITPPGYPRRFKAYFFAARVQGDPAISVDGSEIVAYRWLRPASALALHRQRQLPLLLPQRHTLQDMSHCASAKHYLARCRQRRCQQYIG